MSTNDAQSGEYLPQPEIQTGEEGFDLLQLGLIFLKHLRLVLFCTLAMGIGAYVVTLFIHRAYGAHATFLLESQDSANGLTGNLFFSRPTDPTISLLQSESVSELLVSGQHLEPLFPNMTPRAIQRQAAGEATFARSADGMFIISVTDVKPERAVAIANGYLQALQELNDRMNLDAAKHRRTFYESQVDEERDALEKAELRLTELQQKTGVVQPESQTSMELSTIASLKAQITAQQVALSTLLTGATEQNPEVIRMRTEIDALSAQERRMEASFNGKQTNDIPATNLEYQHRLADVTYHRTLLTSFSSEFQQARLQSTYQSPHVRVVDMAHLPLPITWPPSMKITLIFVAIGFFLGILLAGMRHMAERLMVDPERRLQVEEMKHSLRRALFLRS
ncbi:GumC family protein [Terriglobus saanensis]|uniref:Lipopolysaccharide biosynthesis protein n=1 Tax=Terriglobus saanensis (strain ATCC BAA-1853 / DSM 23119 / SP1PR4) TaxID=401053 RepID=E8UY33_TERSS|nr:Wzz/FepE/Etk N-terminal domain-containing protein [Terriglobus saanensis]ADV84267.1 lipopolysaccharide biosynthesis protein [Terriglobus saanensis SP1PR4]